jgi:hypothetical protein
VHDARDGAEQAEQRREGDQGAEVRTVRVLQTLVDGAEERVGGPGVPSQAVQKRGAEEALNPRAASCLGQGGARPWLD